MKITKERLKERPFVFKRSLTWLDGMGYREVYVAFHKRTKRESFVHCGIAIRNPTDKQDGGYAHKLASDRALGVEPGGFKLGKTILSSLRTHDRTVIDPMIDYVIAMHRHAMKHGRYISNNGDRQGKPLNHAIAVPFPSVR